MKNVHVCVERGAHGVAMYPVTFDDKDGYWCLNLWYSKMLICGNIKMATNREERMCKSQDFFMFSHPTQSSKLSVGTIICRSWRVRIKSGEIRLPQPHHFFL